MTKHTKKVWPTLFALGLVLLLVAAACSSDDSADRDTYEEIGLPIDSEGGFAETTTTMAAFAPDDGDERSDLSAGQLGSGGVEPVVFQTSGFERP